MVLVLQFNNMIGYTFNFSKYIGGFFLACLCIGCEFQKEIVLIDSDKTTRSFLVDRDMLNRVSVENNFLSLWWENDELKNEAIFSKYLTCAEEHDARDKALSAFITFEQRAGAVSRAKRVIETGEIQNGDGMFSRVVDLKYSYYDYALLPNAENQSEIYLLCVAPGNCNLVFSLDQKLSAEVSFPTKAASCYPELLLSIPTFINNITLQDH